MYQSWLTKKLSKFQHTNIKGQYNIEVLKIFNIRGFYVSPKECIYQYYKSIIIYHDCQDFDILFSYLWFVTFASLSFSWYFLKVSLPTELSKPPCIAQPLFCVTETEVIKCEKLTGCDFWTFQTLSWDSVRSIYGYCMYTYICMCGIMWV